MKRSDFSLEHPFLLMINIMKEEYGELELDQKLFLEYKSMHNPGNKH